MARKQLGKKRGGPTPKGATRRMLRNFEARNRYEQMAVTPASIERGVRARIQSNFPDLTPAEVEVRVARSMAHGMGELKVVDGIAIHERLPG